jgi:apolipoprotein N-acyltransferase
VRERVRRGADLLVNVTNDGWFGRSSGPRHHAMMARMRSIENGVSLARCANSGISMFVDPLGRVLGQTGLYERTMLVRTIPHYTLRTLYTRFGDWFVLLCAGMILAAVPVAVFTRRKRS